MRRPAAGVLASDIDGERTALAVSSATIVVAAAASAASFWFWSPFHRDVPLVVGNMRGTALTVLALAVPTLGLSMWRAGAGSLRARFVWLGALGYIAYNAVMFCFAVSFNRYFLLYTTLLALSFWALVTVIATFDRESLPTDAEGVPVGALATYLLVSLVAFAGLWLASIVPATLDGSWPEVLAELGVSQNPVWVLDFAFTFPLMLLGSLWVLQRRPWGYVLAGAMVIMLTLETASIAVDQLFGRLHEPTASLGAVPPMVIATAVGLLFSVLFLRGLRGKGR